MAIAKGANAIAIGSTISIGATAGSNALDRQYVSDPIGAGAIAGTVSMQLMTREFANTDNVDRIAMRILVVSGDGNTVRGTLLALSNAGTTLEFINSATCRNHTGANAAALTSVTAQDGDRIVVEIGYSISAAGTTPQAAAKWGDNATDLPANNNAQTTDGAGWVEFSANIPFPATIAVGATTTIASSPAAVGRGAGSILGGAATLSASSPAASGSGSALASPAAAPVVVAAPAAVAEGGGGVAGNAPAESIAISLGTTASVGSGAAVAPGGADGVFATAPAAVPAGQAAIASQTVAVALVAPVAGASGGEVDDGLASAQAIALNLVSPAAIAAGDEVEGPVAVRRAGSTTIWDSPIRRVVGVAAARSTALSLVSPSAFAQGGGRQAPYVRQLAFIFPKATVRTWVSTTSAGVSLSAPGARVVILPTIEDEDRSIWAMIAQASAAPRRTLSIQ